VGCLVAQGVRFVVGPQDPKGVTRDTARDFSGLAGELAALKADAHHWLDGTEYTTPLSTAWRTPTRLLRRR